MTDHLKPWPAFVEAVRLRLAKGQREYGDHSFSADPKVLINELQQEALDLAGWGYVLYRRLESMRLSLRFVELQSDAEPTLPPISCPPSEPPKGRLVGVDRGRECDGREGYDVVESEQIP